MPFALALGLLLGATGCVRRTITITSTPAGALVYLNDREVGRTPVQVDFLYYGDYDVRLVLSGYEPLATMGRARAPWWDTLGLDLIAEAAPGEPHSRTVWHYDLIPLPEESAAPAASLIERARDLRDQTSADENAPEEGESDAEESPGEGSPRS